MTAQELADLIYRKTGQATPKGTVIGKLDRLRAEKARREHAEDLAKVPRERRSARGCAPEDDWRRQRAPVS